ncbi:hypothetical protein NKI72_14845, partial [Mesorhizobium sp. M0437]|uniref:hypothetical protein n=2 Tax=unclassified Mesorhizobium TaxID=325217 RepID=UPI0033364651
MKADIFFPEKLPAERGSAMHEGGRLALKRDQQKWNPVLRHPLAFSPCEIFAQKPISDSVVRLEQGDSRWWIVFW